MLIFVLQAIWLYIKELAGKDLDVITVFKFLFYVTPTLIPLILPLTILLSSIMVFGSFAENYEFAAMKSTGISLQRAMKSLMIFIGGLAIITFIFSNNIIPWAEYKSLNLRKNIAKKKPAMIIAEGQFNAIGDNFNIKVEKKYGENGENLEGIIIHQKAKFQSNQHKTTVAKTGKLIGSKNSNILKLILFDGYNYDDTPPKTSKERRRHPLTKTFFKKYVTNLDLSEFNKIDLDEAKTTNGYKMLNIVDLNYTIDSLKQQRAKDYESFTSTLLKRSNANKINENITNSGKNKDSLNRTILDLFSPKKQVQVIDNASNTVRSTIQIINSKKVKLENENNWLNKHAISLHKKFALAAACIILFFVGAPLGALIRKGGMGLPMVIAIVLFLSYHFIGLFAENSAKSGSLNPVLSAYFSTLIMLPLSIFLTKRATADRGIFEFDHITEPIKKKLGIGITGIKVEKAFEKSTVNTLKPLYNDLTDNRSVSLVSYLIVLVSFILYFVFKNNKLPALMITSLQIGAMSFVIYIISFIKAHHFKRKINIVTKNFNTPLLFHVLGLFVFPISFVYLNRFKYDFSSLTKGKIKDSNIKKIDTNLLNTPEVKSVIKNYNITAFIALITNVLALILFLTYFILKNNNLESLAMTSIQLSIISFCIFIVYFLKSNQLGTKYNRLTQTKSVNTIIKLIGFFIYPIIYIHRKKQFDRNIKL
jgi:lipopolysaccharide export system permease protein